MSPVVVYSHEFAQKAACSGQDLKEFHELVDVLVGLAFDARCHGLLTLEPRLPGLPHPMLRDGMELITDGIDPAIVSRILSLNVIGQVHPPREYLIRCMIMEGVLAIQQGVPRRILIQLLLSLVGDQSPGMSHAEKQTIALRSSEFASQTRAPGDSTVRRLCHKLSTLEDRALQRVLREMEDYQITSFLLHADSDITTRILRNLSPAHASDVLQVLGQERPWQPGRTAQEILSLIGVLEAFGEIVAPRAVGASILDRALGKLGALGRWFQRKLFPRPRRSLSNAAYPHNSVIVYDAGFTVRASCTQAERQTLEPLVEFISRLAIDARMHGILALHDRIQDIAYPLLRLGISLLVDGTQRELLGHIIALQIVASGKTGVELLEACIIMEGLDCVRCGDLPRMVQTRLHPLLGTGGPDPEIEF